MLLTVSRPSNSIHSTMDTIMNSNIIYKEITPTYLYVKEHSITGMRYLGKTTRNDPYKYNGSGTDWVEHINEYGKEHIKTIWVSKIFTDTRIKDFAILASKHWNIVNSKDWANLKLETGLDGNTSEQAIKINNERIKNGTHPWLGPAVNLKRVEEGTHHLLGGDIQRKNNKKLVVEGTHHLLGPAVNLKRVEEGTHHLLGPTFNLKRVADGTHPFVGKGNDVRIRNLKMFKDGTHQFLSKKENPLWLEVKQLYFSLGIKIPNGTWTKNNKSLEIIRDELLKCLNNNRI